MPAFIDEHHQFVDTGGKPIVNGYLYVGTRNLDPKLNPITIYSDRDLTTPLANPQRTDSGGRAVQKIWVPGRYSLKVENSANVQMYQNLDNGEETGAQTLSLSNIQGINAVTAEANPTITAYVDKAQYVFTVVNPNTTDAVTVAIDGLSAVSVKRNLDQDVGKGKWKANDVIHLTYNSAANVMLWTNENNKVFLETKGADIASAATIDLSAATGNYIHITGAAGPVTSLGTVLAGAEYTLVFDSTPTVNHNATSLIMPGSANRTMVAGDKMHVRSEGSGNFRVMWIEPGDGSAVIIASQAEAEAGTNNLKAMTPLRVAQAIDGYGGRTEIFTANGTYNVPDGSTSILVEAIGAGGGGCGADTPSNGSGGGSGGYVLAIVSVTAGGTEAIVIGAGGAGGAGGGNPGSAGGNTTVGSTKVVANGGGGATDVATPGTAGGFSSTETIIAGFSGFAGQDNTSGVGGGANIGIYPSEKLVAWVSGGADGVNAGSGGSGGSASNGPAGDGADGIVIITPLI